MLYKKKNPALGSMLAIIIPMLAVDGCRPKESGASLLDVGAYTGSIRVSLAHPFNVQNDDFELLFAVLPTATALGVCLASATPTCIPGGPGYFPALGFYATEERRFFKAKNSALLENGLVLTVVASDETGQVIDTRNLKFTKGGSPATGSTPAGATATTLPDAIPTFVPGAIPTFLPNASQPPIAPPSNSNAAGGGGNDDEGEDDE